MSIQLPTKAEVRSAYRRHFAVLRDSADAHNATLEMFAGPYDPAAPKSEHKARSAIAAMIQEVSGRVELELGDPFAVAMRDAMKALRADKVKSVARDQYKDIVQSARDEAKSTGESVEQLLEQMEGPYLYVLFDDDGQFQSWTIDYPDYFQGHDGPVASVPVGPGGVDYDDVEGEIGETLAQSVDWKTIGRRSS